MHRSRSSRPARAGCRGAPDRRARRGVGRLDRAVESFAGQSNRHLSILTRVDISGILMSIDNEHDPTRGRRLGRRFGMNNLIAGQWPMIATPASVERDRFHRIALAEAKV